MSDKPAFTPGPWEVYAQQIGGAGDAVLELVEQVQATQPIGGALYLINADGKCPATTGCGPTSEANAHLIAAAPELYTLLSRVLPLLPDFEHAVAKLVLAKARGEQTQPLKNGDTK